MYFKRDTVKRWLANQINWHVEPQLFKIKKAYTKAKISCWQRLNNVNKESLGGDGQHPIFQSYANFMGPKSKGCEIDFIGCKHLAHYVPSDYVEKSEEITEYSATLPAVDEEYFEWIDVLESAADAQKSYCIVELGAGYGRWSARGYKAAIANGLKHLCVTIVAVEADPKHFKWMQDHFEVNELSGNLRLYQAAVNSHKQDVDFFIAQPNVDPNDDIASRKWYGQAISNFGWDGATSIRVKSLTLSDVLPLNEQKVDLLDIDIQGYEFEVLNSGIDNLRNVKRVHIGTHSREIEEKLIHLFNSIGWKCIRNYPCNSVTQTSYGVVSFCDGVQTWINPRA